MWWGVLGPLDARDDAGSVQLGGGTVRAVAALLLGDSGRVVPTLTLLEAIWPDHAVRGTSSTLHVAVSRLRTALGRHAERVEATPGGYRLCVDGDEVDAVAATGALRAGRELLERGDASRAAELFDEALDRWRGPPLCDLATFPFHGHLTRRWVDLRSDLLEARNDAYLACGRHPEVAILAAADAVAEPWRERFRCQQVLALYRSARQIEALAALDEHRRRLSEELGISPCPALADLEVRILRQDPALLDPDRRLSAEGFVV